MDDTGFSRRHFSVALVVTDFWRSNAWEKGNKKQKHGVNTTLVKDIRANVS